MSTRTCHDLLEVDSLGDITTVHFTRRTILAVEAIEAVGERLLDLVHHEGARKVVLDFAKVESLTSSMLGKFVTLNNEIESLGGRVVFCNVDIFLGRIFEICGMPRQIAILPDLPAALAALAD